MKRQKSGRFTNRPNKASQSSREARINQIRFSSDMCGGKTPSGVRDARPSHRPSEAKPSAINASIQPESSPAAFRLSALRAQSDSPVFQLPLEIRGYAAVFGSIIETSLSAVWVMRWVFAGLVRFRNRSFDLLRRDGPCRLPDGFVHWTHLLAWDLDDLLSNKSCRKKNSLCLRSQILFKFYLLH